MRTRFWITIAATLMLAVPALAQNAPAQDQSNTVSATPAKLSGQDQSFLQKAAEAAVSEIKLGQLAVAKASDPQVKQFGQHATDDFNKAKQQLSKIATGLKWIAPDHMSQDAAGQYDDLWARQGKDFDSRYIGDEIGNYQSYVPLFENEADHGTDHQLAMYAQSQLPTLRGRLDTAKRLGNKVGS